MATASTAAVTALVSDAAANTSGPAASPYGLTLADGHRYHTTTSGGAAVHAGDDLTLHRDDLPLTTFRVTGEGDTLTLHASAKDFAWPAQALLPVLAAVFCHHKAVRHVRVLWVDADPAHRVWLAGAVRAGIGERIAQADGALTLEVSRQTFWQHAALWLRGPSSAGMAQQYVVSDGKRHPLRAPKPAGVVYRRHIARLNTEFTLRAIDQPGDAALLNEWMNLDSVAHFWEQTGSLEEHTAYLEKMQADPHTVTLFGCFDGEPFAYFEVYWAKEDRIAPFSEAADYDRGFHLLVGSTKFRSPGRTEAWLRSIVHYIFLDDPRTQRIVGEPRIDHDRWIAYMQGQGAARLREFDFPHKRAVLIAFERQTIFEQYAPW